MILRGFDEKIKMIRAEKEKRELNELVEKLRKQAMKFKEDNKDAIKAVDDKVNYENLTMSEYEALLDEEIKKRRD